MKRGLSPDSDSGRTAKRQHHISPTELFEDLSLQQVASEIAAHGTDGTGYIAGNVTMVWPSTDPCLALLNTVEEGVYLKVRVAYSSSFNIKFHSGDEVKIALKGANCTQVMVSGRPIPRFEFEDGIIVQFVSRSKIQGENGTIFDSWAGNKQDDTPNEPAQDDWFSSRPPDSTKNTDVPTVQEVSAPVLSARNRRQETEPFRRRSLGNPNLRQGLQGSPGHRIPVIPAYVPRQATNRSSRASSISTNDSAKPIATQKRRATMQIIQTDTEINNVDAHKPVSAGTRSASPAAIQANPPSGGSSSPRVPTDIKTNMSSSTTTLLKSTTKTSSTKETLSEAPKTDTSSNTRPEAPPESKKMLKKLKKQEKRKALDLTAQNSKPNLPEQSLKPTSGILDITVPLPAPQIKLQNVPLDKKPKTDASQRSMELASVIARHPALDMNPGLLVGTFATYEPIDAMNQNNHCYNVIAVACNVGMVKKTRSEDWTCTITITDPSKCNADSGFSRGFGFKVVCFTGPKYRQWLPCPAPGDIIILHNIKVSTTFGNAVGHRDHLKWAIFKPSTGRISHGDLGLVPEHDLLVADDPTSEFSPFIPHGNLQEAELGYCLSLVDWWEAVNAYHSELLADPGVTVHLIEATRNTVERQHRLISETGPDVAPQGYFDCTVEILNGFPTENGMTHTLYVTDYTYNPQIIPVTATWCSPALAPLVLQLEMWDAAAMYGPMMQPGEYWHLKNARIIHKQSGRFQGKIVEKKMYKLDPENPEGEVALKALLKRKAEWEEGAEMLPISDDVPKSFPHSLFSEAEVEKLFTTTVEVLHISSETAAHYVYVTDYTARDDFSPPPQDTAFLAELEGYVVQIQLMGGQETMSELLEVGKYYVISNLRLRRRTTTPGVQAYIKGYTQMFKKLKHEGSKDEQLKSLLRRKKLLLKDTEEAPVKQESTRKPKPTSKPAVVPPRELKMPAYCVSIEEMRNAAVVPSTFKIAARVINFWPETLENCVIKRCTKCLKDINPMLNACTGCEDNDVEHVEHILHMALMIKDAAGSMICVHVDPTGEFLKGIKTVDYRDDSDALKVFTERWAPFLGDLPEYQANKKEGERMPETSLFTIGSWRHKHAHIMYDMQNIEPLP